MNRALIPSGTENQTAIIAVSGLAVTLATISIILRFYTRIFTKAGLRWDDWLLLAAFVLGLLEAALLVWRNIIDLNSEQAVNGTDPDYHESYQGTLFLKLGFVNSILYFTIVSLTKLSILLMYNRLFFVNGTFRRQLVVVGIITFGFWIGCTIAVLTDCLPMKWNWLNSMVSSRYCYNTNIFWLAAGLCKVFIDVLILELPIRVVLTLKLSVGRKAAIACIFMLGGFVIITGLIKAILGYEPGFRSPSYSRTGVWTTLHTAMGFVCACLPIFKPLLSRISKLTWIWNMAKFSARQWSHIGSWFKTSGRQKERASESNTSIEEDGSEAGLRDIRSPQQQAGYTCKIEKLVLREDTFDGFFVHELTSVTT